MKTMEFIVERADLGDGVMPLARYEVRQNVGDGRHKRFESLTGNICFLADAVKVVLQHARKGLKSSDIRMVKLVVYTDQEGTKHGKA